MRRSMVVATGLIASVALLRGAPPAVAVDSPYLLPVPAGTTITVTTGNGGNHAGYEYFAFDIAIGKSEFPVAAARGGTVRGVRSDSSAHCWQKTDSTGTTVQDLSCWAEANYVVIDHGDGTWALYLHLKQGSIQVTQGAGIPRGRLLATADNTGYSSNNHLHYQVESSSRCSSLVWWWCQSVASSFADPDVVSKTGGTGVPVAWGTYTSSNATPPTATARPGSTLTRTDVTTEPCRSGDIKATSSEWASYWPKVFVATGTNPIFATPNSGQSQIGTWAPGTVLTADCSRALTYSSGVMHTWYRFTSWDGVSGWLDVASARIAPQR